MWHQAYSSLLLTQENICSNIEVYDVFGVMQGEISMIRAHKIRLHPTAEQAISFAKAAGTARFVWNWALAE